MARCPASLERAHANDVSSAMVVVIDDDPSVRDALQNLLESIGLKAEVFRSAQEFLADMDPAQISCLVLDVRLPGKNGLDFHDELKRSNASVPVVFITGYGDIPMSVRAMKAGAIEFLAKPFRDQDLLDAVQLAIERDRERRERQHAAAALQAKYATLTVREREIMARMAEGLPNRVIATQLGISEVTVKAHRRQVMVKLGANTLAALIRMSDMLNSPTAYTSV